MKKPNKISNTTEAISQNVHRHDKWLISQRQNAEKRLTPKQFKWFKKYDDDLVMSGVSHATRHTNLTRFVKLVTEYNLEDLEKITVEQVKEIVVNIMRKHGRNGQESWYSQDTKKQLKHIIRFAKTGSRFVPDTGELRDNSLLQTKSGTQFMQYFNDIYYSFSPVIADYERENPYFKEAVKLAITPLISSLSILNYVNMDSEESVLGYGISLIILNLGMYLGVPAVVIIGIKKIK